MKMTAQDAIALFGKSIKYADRKETADALKSISEIIEQQQSTIEKLKCCGNCKKWNNEWTYTGIDNYCDDRNTINPASTDKCDKWEGIA